MDDNIDSDFEISYKKFTLPPLFFSSFIGDHSLQFFKIQLWYQSLSLSFFIHFLPGKGREKLVIFQFEKKRSLFQP